MEGQLVAAGLRLGVAARIVLVGVVVVRVIVERELLECVVLVGVLMERELLECVVLVGVIVERVVVVGCDMERILLV